MAGGPLYVNHDYWAWGYSDGVPAAGDGGGKGRQPGRRRWWQVDDKVYWANERELPQLLAQIVAEPEAEPPVRAEQSRRPAKALPAAERIHIPALQLPSVEARFEALQTVFAQREDPALLAALAIARAQLEQENEEEELMLLLA